MAEASKKKATTRKTTRKKTTTAKTQVAKQEAGFNELGTTGLRQYSGRLNEEFLVQLKGHRKYKVYKEMTDNDPIVGALLFAITTLIRQVKWFVQPASEDAKDVEIAEFVETCLHDMSTSFEDTLAEILSFLPNGYSYQEIVYKKRGGRSTNPKTNSKHDDGKIGWRKLPIRAQDTLDHWKLDDDGGIQAFIQRDPNTGKINTIPIGKALLFRTSTHKNNPEGRSILRNAYRPWFFKKRIEEIEGIGIERDLAGLPVMTIPAKIMNANASADEKAVFEACKDIVRNIRRDEQEGVLMPGDMDQNNNPLYELKLLSTGGSRQFDTNTIVNRYDQRIAMVVLADFILLGHEKVGSFALADNKTNLFAVAIGAFLDSISSVFDRHAIPRLLDINGMAPEEIPTLKHEDIETPDLDKLAKYIKELSGSGAELFPDMDLENHLRRLAGLPERIEDDDELDDDDKDDASNVTVIDEPEEDENTAEKRKAFLKWLNDYSLRSGK